MIGFPRASLSPCVLCLVSPCLLVSNYRCFILGFVRGYPRDSQVNYACFNGFSRNVSFSSDFQITRTITPQVKCTPISPITITNNKDDDDDDDDVDDNNNNDNHNNNISTRCPLHYKVLFSGALQLYSFNFLVGYFIFQLHSSIPWWLPSIQHPIPWHLSRT